MEEYFEKRENSNKCPKCGSNDIWEDGLSDYDLLGDLAWSNQYWTCGTCGLEYMVCFKFDHIEWFEEEEK